MSEWRQDLVNALSTSLPVGILASVIYLIVAFVLAAQRVPRGYVALDRRVNIEAVCGMVLAVPALLYGALGGLGESWHWSGAVLLVATGGAYAVAIAAMRGVTLTPWQRSVPPVLAFAGLPLAAVVEFANYAQDDPLAGASQVMLLLMFGSYFGFGYLAWCVVGVRFARAVARCQALEASRLEPAHAALPSPRQT